MASAKKGPAKEGSKSTLSKLQLIGYGLGDLGGCMTFAIMGSFLTPYYTDVAHIDPMQIAGMYMVLKIWDAINDPLMGALMDKLFARSHNPKGKFRPWMFRATPPAVHYRNIDVYRPHICKRHGQDCGGFCYLFAL